MSGDALPYSDDLVATFGETVFAYLRTEGPGIEPRRLLVGLLNAGVGLVDTSRRSFLVDLNVHQGVQVRLREIERQHPPRHIVPAIVWKGLPR